MGTQTFHGRGSPVPLAYKFRGCLRRGYFLVGSLANTLATRTKRGTMTYSLFDSIGDIQLDRPGHNCTGQLCTYCERFDRQDVQVLAEIDKNWRIQATIFRKSLAIGGLFTADLLIEAIGLPDGHPNQIGALFRSWASMGVITSMGNYVLSTRQSNNGRSIRMWKRTA
jgi:hypothetical protein